MKKIVEIPFDHIDDLYDEYKGKFLVITNCNVDPLTRIWDKTGILRVVCSTYRECLQTEAEYWKNSELMGYGFVRHYQFMDHENWQGVLLNDSVRH